MRIAEPHHAEHGSENFFPRNRHAVCDTVEDGGLYIKPAFLHVGGLTTTQQFCAFLLPFEDVAEHRIELCLIHQRTHDRVRVKGIGRLVLRY